MDDGDLEAAAERPVQVEVVVRLHHVPVQADLALHRDVDAGAEAVPVRAGVSVLAPVHDVGAGVHGPHFAAELRDLPDEDAVAVAGRRFAGAGGAQPVQLGAHLFDLEALLAAQLLQDDDALVQRSEQRVLATVAARAVAPPAVIVVGVARDARAVLVGVLARRVPQIGRLDRFQVQRRALREGVEQHLERNGASVDSSAEVPVGSLTFKCLGMSCLVWASIWSMLVAWNEHPCFLNGHSVEICSELRRGRCGQTAV